MLGARVAHGGVERGIARFIRAEIDRRPEPMKQLDRRPISFRGLTGQKDDVTRIERAMGKAMKTGRAKRIRLS